MRILKALARARAKSTGMQQSNVWRAAAAIALLAAFAYGCSKQPVTTGGAPTARATLANPSTFPLYAPSTIISVAPFDQAQMAQTMNASLSGNEKKMTPYKGSEVLAATSASLVELKSWLKKVEDSPPQRLKLSVAPAGVGGGRAVGFADRWGADAASFTDGAGRSVVVMVMDPKVARAKLGPALNLIDKYQSLPALVRGSIDARTQQRFGVTVSQMLDKSGPIGLFVAAVNELATTDQRALILIDATKE